MSSHQYIKIGSMKRILVVNGHPRAGSYNYAVQDAYLRGLAGKDVEVREIRLAELQFDLNLSEGYTSAQALEPDLVEAQAKILWADHVVWIFPLWWGMMPAVLKGFIDRVLLPGYAFRYRPKSSLWDKLLKGKTSAIICTIDYPIWYFRLFLRGGGVGVMRKMVLEFCGFEVTRTTYLGPVRPSTLAQREEWLRKVERIAGV